MQAFAGVHVLAVSFNFKNVVLSQIVQRDAVVSVSLGGDFLTIQTNRTDVV